MPAGIAFWIVMLLGLLLGAWGFYPAERRFYAPFGFLLWIAVLILGIHSFGAPLK